MSNLQKFSVVDLHTNTTFLSYVVPLFQNESSCKVLQMKMPLMCMVVWTYSRNTFSYEWFRTKTRFETEAESNSEMVCFKNSSSRINDVMALGLKGLLGVFRGEGRGSVCMASYGKEIIVVDWW